MQDILPNRKKELTTKQETFLSALFNNGGQVMAAIETAGYSPDSRGWLMRTVKDEIIDRAKNQLAGSSVKAINRLREKTYSLDFVREILEQASILYNSKKSGIVELGGGVPKNTAQQTGPLLDQILRQNVGGQDYIIQITDARPDTGGLSGATLQEGKSWGKVQDAHHDMVTDYADATIAFPILALYVISNQKSRKPKRLYKKLDSYYDNLKNGFFQNTEKYYDK